MFDETTEQEVELQAIIKVATERVKSLEAKIADLNKLQTDRDRWQLILQEAQELLGETHQPEGAVPGQEMLEDPSKSENVVHYYADISTKSNKEKAKAIILKNGRPMRLQDIVRVFHDQKWKLSEENGSEVLRGMLWREKNMFKRIDKGLYDVIK